ncbi:hypothetical protein KBB48_01690 [Candidatus Shapirobacteria bacterium]|nr:hypothetical protein [Candidatus Shapirobacteria bacterium]
MKTLEKWFYNHIGARQPKTLSEMSDPELQKIVDINAALRTRHGNNPTGKNI